ncbi:MAG: hypothetical protein ACKVOU_01585 [Cytophagales bacterium]
MQQIEFNVFFFIQSVKKHLKTFLVINAIVAISALIYTLVTPVLYESKAVFYPYSPESNDPRIMLYDEAHFSVFGYSDQVERYINIGKSNGIKYFIANKYNLAKRYQLDTLGNKPIKYKILEKIHGNLKFAKGEQGAITVSYTFFDRDTAALICNDIVNQIDSVNASLFIQKNIEVFNLYKMQLAQLEASISTMKDSVNNLANSKQQGDSKLSSIVQSQLDFSLAEYAKAKVKYELTKSFTTRQLRTLYLIEPAQATYKKAFPDRKLIIGGAVIVCLLLTTVTFSIVEFVKNNKEKFLI